MCVCACCFKFTVVIVCTCAFTARFYNYGTSSSAKTFVVLREQFESQEKKTNHKMKNEIASIFKP